MIRQTATLLARARRTGRPLPAVAIPDEDTAVPGAAARDGTLLPGGYGRHDRHLGRAASGAGGRPG